MASINKLQQAKSVLRKQMKERMKKLTEKEKQMQSNLVVKKALEHEMYKESTRISIFLPMANELNTLPLLQRILLDGKQCFIPNYRGQDMIMEQLKTWEEYEALPLTSWNIKQPSNFDASKDAKLTGGLDLIFMPGVAFTVQGARLGHGKGYYDTYLASCSDHSKKPKTIALAFYEQIVEEIPLTDHDVMIDQVLYPSLNELTCESTSS